MGIFDETYLRYIEACRSAYFETPRYGVPKKHKPATKSHEEQKKCKSCKYFLKSEIYCYCSKSGKQVWPYKEACSSYTKRKGRLKCGIEK